MSDRIKVPRVAEMTGMSPRAVQKMAHRIPSAARFGRLWTFREEAVRQWVRGKEEETWRGTSIDAARPGGVEFSTATKNYEKVYERLIGPKRKSGSAIGKSS